jgi:hypothetical protein
MENGRTDDWYFVWGWWPAPRFLFSLLGASGCEAFVDRLNERQLGSPLLVSFALAIEHRDTAINSETDLEEFLSRVCAPGYDFSPASSLEFSVSRARWARITRENERAAERTPQAPDSREVLQREMEAKGLPAGREENLALMRATLTARTKV